MKRKLKKLDQILAENSSYSVNGKSFYFDGSMPCINFSMIRYFGGTINMNHDEIRIWKWDESWFEQPVKKKLYAFRTPYGFVGYYDSERERVGDMRAPEFDLDFGDSKGGAG